MLENSTLSENLKYPNKTSDLVSETARFTIATPLRSKASKKPEATMEKNNLQSN